MNTKTIQSKLTSVIIFLVLGVFSTSLFFYVPSTVLADNNLTVSTYPASSISETGATLNGYIAGPSGKKIMWFKYGKNSSLTMATQSKVTYKSGIFKIRINKLEKNTTYYYKAVAIGEDGIVYGNTLSFVTNGENIPKPQVSYNNSYPIVNNINTTQTQNRNLETTVPTVITHLPKKISKTSATIAGLALPGKNTTTIGWFEWGKTATSLVNETTHKNIGSTLSIDFSEDLTGLSQNTAYYYRAVIQTSTGVKRGTTLVFKTTKSLIINPTSVIPISSTKHLPKKPPKKEVEVKKTKEKQTAATVFASNSFFPDTLVEWLALVALLLAITAFGSYIYNTIQKRKFTLENDEEK
jgi:hypothetical protein